MAVQTQILHRRDTAANWTAANPVLGGGELGFETDTNKFKIGNGSTVWASLNYFVSSDSPTFTGVAGIPMPKFGYSTTATAAGTTVLVFTSNYRQVFTGTTTQTITLPVASTMTVGQGFVIVNNSTGNLTINSSGGNLVLTVIAGLNVFVKCILASGTTAASWDVDYSGFSTITGTGANVLASSPTLLGTPQATTATAGNSTSQIATTAFVQTAAQTASANVQGLRNKIINGDFSVNQRVAFNTSATGVYVFDRWRLNTSDGTSTYSTQSFALGNPFTGFQPRNYLQLVTSGQTLTTANSIIIQPIEDVRTCAGSQVTVSFWAKALSGTPKISVELGQYFGADPDRYINAGQVTLSTSWARYSRTVTVTSISGKIIGPNNDSHLSLNLWCSAGSSFNVRTGSLGIQSNTFHIWGVQLEQNSVPTAFEQELYADQLAKCQRYYYKSGYVWGNELGSGFIANNSNQFGEGFTFHHPVTLRANPTLTYTFFNNDNAQLLSAVANKTTVALRETCANTTYPYSSFSFDYVVSAEMPP